MKESASIFPSIHISLLRSLIQKSPNLTAGDPHAGVVPLEQLPHHHEGVGLHLPVDPHQSPHCVCILGDKICTAPSIGYLRQLSSCAAWEEKPPEKQRPQPCLWLHPSLLLSCKHSEECPGSVGRSS